MPPPDWILDDEPVVALRCALWSYNSIGVIGGDAACAVDPGITPAEVALLRARLEAGGRRVTHVVLTHSHHDHIRGWQAFPGATIVMPRVAADKPAAARERILAGKNALDARLGLAEPEFAYPEADVRFDERHAIDLGGVTLDLRFLPGHSNCASVAVVAECRTLLSADYLLHPGLPYCRFEARAFEEAHRTLRSIVVDEGIERAVPAHERVLEGRAAILAAIDEELAYFDFLRELVRRRLAAGEGEEAIARAAALALGARRGVDLGPRAVQDLDNARRVLAEEAGAR